MGWPRLLVLVRHAESFENVDLETRTAAEQARCRSISLHQYPLTPRGRKQARLTGRFLRQRYDSFNTYYTSYYARAVQTARILFPRAQFREDPRLTERQDGFWHGLPRDMLQQLFSEELQRAEGERLKREGPYHHRPPGGESFGDVEIRIQSFLDTLARDHAGEAVLAVTHGTWLLLFERILKGFPTAEAGRRNRASALFATCSVTTLTCTHASGAPRLFLESENVIPWQGKC